MFFRPKPPAACDANDWQLERLQSTHPQQVMHPVGGVSGFMAMKDVPQLRLETPLQRMHSTASFMYAMVYLDNRISLQLMPKCGAITLSASAYCLG